MFAVSQISIAAPLSRINQLNSFICTFLPFLNILCSISRFCSLKTSTNSLAADFAPKLLQKRVMAGYYQVVFISPQCTGLKTAVLLEVNLQWESQPCPWATVSPGFMSWWLCEEQLQLFGSCPLLSAWKREEPRRAFPVRIIESSHRYC